MIDALDQEITPAEAYESEFEFKGQELKPFTEGRRSVAYSIGVRMGGDPAPTVTDMHALLYICICNPKELSKAHRNPDAFFGKILEWVDKNITPDDYEEEGRIVKRMLDAANATKVREIIEPGGTGDSLGN
jgi:hypothetical protein